MSKNANIYGKRLHLSVLLIVLVLAFMVGCARDSDDTTYTSNSTYTSNPTSPSNPDESGNPSGTSNPTATGNPTGSSNGSGLDNSYDFVVARVNGIDITASDVRIGLHHAEEMMVWDYFMMFGGFEIDHDAEFSPGVTFRRAIKEEAVRIAAFSKLYEEHARQLDINLTDEEQILIDEEIARLIEQFGQQELNELLRADGFRDQYHLAELYASHFILDSLINVIIADPEQFARFEQYIPEEEPAPELLGAKHILALFANFDTEEEAEAYAWELFERAMAGEDFDMLIREYGQDPGMMNFPDGYSFGSGDMVPEFEQTTRELAVGEISEPVRTVHGFHVIMRTEPNEADWHRLHFTQPRTLESRMMEAVFQGFQSMLDYVDIEFLPALDNLALGQ